jgi:hypothetical protein
VRGGTGRERIHTRDYPSAGGSHNKARMATASGLSFESHRTVL